MITQEELKEKLSYDPNTGLFTWKNNGKNAGWLHDKGHSKKYWRIELNQKCYYRSRLAWLYVYGEIPECIDHINQDQLDDRIFNLRNVTHSENMKNQKKHKNNKTGIMGVHFDKAINKYRAAIGINGKQVKLGCYGNIFDAACARKSAELSNSYHVNHGAENNEIQNW